MSETEMLLGEAAERSKELEKNFRALLAVGKVLREINDLDLSLAASRTAEKKGRADLAEVQQKLADAQEQLTSLQAQMEDLRKRRGREETALKMLVRDVRQQAEAEAARILADARAEADRIAQESAAMQEAAKAAVAEIEAKAQEGRDNLRKLKEQFASLVQTVQETPV